MPAGWPGYTMTFRIEGAEYTIEVDNTQGAGNGVASVTVDGKAAADGRVRLEPGSGRHTVHVILSRAVEVSDPGSRGERISKAHTEE